MKALYRFVTVPVALLLFLCLSPFVLIFGALAPEEKRKAIGLSFRDLIKGTVEFFD